MDILKTILMIIFAIDCIALCRKVRHRDLVLSEVCQQTHTGDRTRDVLWKEHL